MKFKQIYLEITKECNLRCPFCPAVFEKKTHWGLDQIRTIIANTKDYTDTYYLHVLGEPLMHPALESILQIMEESQKNVKITTNGTLLNQWTDILAKYSCLKQINISVQAWINFSKDYRQRLIDNLVFFIMNNVGKMTISLRFWNNKKQEEVKELNRQVFDSINDALKGYPIERLSIDDLYQKRNIRIMPYLLLSIDDEFRWPSLRYQVNNRPYNCLGGKKQLAILNNGDVVLCCLDYLGHTKIGNIFEKKLDLIIKDQIYQSFLEKSQKHESFFELCQKCDYRNRF